MVFVKYKRFALLVGFLILTGCSSGDDIESVFRVRAINLSPNSPVQNVVVGDDLSFTVDFSVGTPFSGGVPGDLALEVRGFIPSDVPGAAPEDELVLRAAQTVTFDRKMDYTVVTHGDAADIQTLILQNPSPGIFAADTSRLRFANVADSGTVDVYLTDLDTDLASETPVGTVSRLGVSPLINQTNGDYQIRITESGTLNLLYDSGQRALDVSQQILFVVGNTPLAGGSPLRLYQLNDAAGSQIADRNTPALVRILQLSPDTPPLDVFVNDEMLTSPVIQNVSFADLTAYTDFPGGAVEIDLTPTGDTSVLLFEDQDTTGLGAEHTYLLAGLAGSLGGGLLFDNSRSISTEVRFRAIHGTTLLGNVDVYITVPGTTIAADTIAFFRNLSLGGVTSVLGVEAGDFEITLTNPGETTAVLGPVPISLVLGGVYTLAFRDSDAGNSVQFMLINDQ